MTKPCQLRIASDRVGSSMVEQRPFKALVLGSSPSQPKIRPPFRGDPSEPPRLSLATEAVALLLDVHARG